jgi:tetratricopeptide (TPR) repeat protein
MQRADDLLSRARRIAPNSERVLIASAAMLRSQDHCDNLTEAAEKLVRLFPNSTVGYNFLGWCKLASGHPEEELPLLQKIMQIEPVGPNISVWYQRMAQDLGFMDRSEEAIHMIDLALAANPDLGLAQRGNAYRVLAICHARLGHLDQA